MRRVLREHEVGQGRRFYRAAARNMKFSGKKIIAAKSGNILPQFKVNLSDSQTLPLKTLGWYESNTQNWILDLGVLPHEIYQHYYVTLRITCISQVLLLTVLQPSPRVAAPSP